MLLRNRVALITGGTRGIGRGIALRLAKEGARIAIGYRANKNVAQNTLRQLQANQLRWTCNNSSPSLVKNHSLGIVTAWNSKEMLGIVPLGSNRSTGGTYGGCSSIDGKCSAKFSRHNCPK